MLYYDTNIKHAAREYTWAWQKAVAYELAHGIISSVLQKAVDRKYKILKELLIKHQNYINAKNKLYTDIKDDG